MMISEAKAARDRLQEWGGYAELPGGIENDIALVCAWTRHWEDTADELGAILAERDNLRRWKDEASAAQADLHRAWISAGKPGPLGMTMAQCMAHEIERLRQAVNDAVAAIADLMVAAEKAREARG